MGKYSPITSVLIQFSQNDLHHLASGDIDILSLYLNTDHEELALDPVSIIRRGTQELLANACVQTTNLSRLPMLVDSMTFSWQAKNGNSRRIRNETQLNAALKHSIDNNLKELVILAHCDILYFPSEFNALDLNQVDTQAFASSPVAAPIPPVPTTATSSVTPPTDIFNYHALPTEVIQRFDAFQDPTVILRVQDMTPFTWPAGTCHNYYTNPAVISSRVILRNGAVY
jgi:hypothetical protein